MQALRQPTPHAHPVLPVGVFFDQIKQIIAMPAVRHRLGLSRARQEALIAMMSCTSPADWQSPDRSPVCFRPQCDLARDLGKTTRAVHADEKALEAAGLLIRDLCNDGSRSATLLADGSRRGLCFSPLIELAPALLALRAEIQAEARACTCLRLECSAARRAVRELLDRAAAAGVSADELAPYRQTYEAWPRRYAAFSKADEFKSHRDEAVDLAHRLRELVRMSVKTSGVEASELPPIIQPTTNLNLEICSGSPANDRPARKRADASLSAGRANALPDCREKELGRPDALGNPHDLSWVTPNFMRSVASDDFAFWLDGLAKEGSITADTILTVAIRRLPELGINPSAWDECVEVMGLFRAAMCVFVIDANRDHPIRPVQKPGGALRAFTRLHAAGKLNLAGSFIGLRERARNG